MQNISIKGNAKIIRELVVCLISLYYLYPFNMEISGWIIVKVVYILLPIVYIILKHRFVLKVFSKVINNSYFMISVLLLIMSLLYAVLTSSFSGDYSFVIENFIKPILKFIRLLFVLLLVEDTYNGKDLFNNYIRVMTYSTALYVLSSLYMIINTSFRDFWLSLVQPDLKLLYVWQNFGRVGLMGRTQADTSLFISLIIIGICIRQKLNYKADTIFITCVLLLVVGNFLYGRLGLFISVLSFIVFFGINTQKHINKKSLIQKIILLIIAIVLGWYFCSFVDKNTLDRIIGLVVEPGKALLSSTSNKFSLGYSGDELRNMYFWMGLKTFLFGDGLYTTAEGMRYMDIDPGIVRKILFGGIFMPLLMYSSAILMIIMFNKLFKRIHKNAFRDASVLLLIFLLLGEFKDSVFTNCYLICLMYTLALSNDYNSMRSSIIDSIKCSE